MGRPTVQKGAVTPSFFSQGQLGWPLTCWDLRKSLVSDRKVRLVNL